MLDGYVTIDEANDIVKSIFPKGSNGDLLWESLDSDGKARAISSAQSILENTQMFVGRKLDLKQKLQFPRVRNGRVMNVPDTYCIAIVQQAVLMLIEQSSETKQMAANGVKSYSVEGASVSFGDAVATFKTKSGLYKEVEALISNYVYGGR